jgi:hypothetical protein
MGTFPFDQPDVEITKCLVKNLLRAQERSGEGAVSTSVSVPTSVFDYVSPPPAASDSAASQFAAPDASASSGSSASYLERSFDDGLIRTLRVSTAVPDVADIFDGPDVTINQVLRMLLGSLESGDYFALNAFLPFRGYGRREALERMRNRVASRLGVVSCLEIGPRYLHSTGQLHKGGPNNGVFLILSADEDNDIVIPGKDFTLGALAMTQARADFVALASRGRRVVQVHLNGNDSETLSRFADHLCSAVSAIRPVSNSSVSHATRARSAVVRRRGQRSLDYGLRPPLGMTK